MTHIMKSILVILISVIMLFLGLLCNTYLVFPLSIFGVVVAIAAALMLIFGMIYFSVELIFGL